jgi:hypothetical protein
MTKYDQAKIYKIVPDCMQDDCDDIYIGSTTKKYLCQRMSQHKYEYKKWKEGHNDCNKTNSYLLFEKYGLENCKIILIEEVSCASKDELKAKEAEYIKTLKNINKQIPNRTYNEFYHDKMKDETFRIKEQERGKLKYKAKIESNPDYNKEYYLKNKDRIKHNQMVYQNKQR